MKAGADEIVVFDNLGRGRPENLAWAIANGPVTLVPGDISDTAALRDAMDGIDVVFHQAAIRITQCAEEPRLAFDVMVAGTFNVAEAAVAAGVGKVVLASSAVGLRDGRGVPDAGSSTTRGRNRTLYGAAKAFDEMLFRSFNEMYELDYVALRYFNVYGPRMAIRGRAHRGAGPLDGDASPTASHHSSSATARRRWTSSTSTTSRARTCSPPRRR